MTNDIILSIVVFLGIMCSLIVWGVMSDIEREERKQNKSKRR